MDKKIMLDFKGVQSLERQWKGKRNLENETFRQLLNNTTNKKINNKKGIEPLMPGTLSKTLSLFIDETKGVNYLNDSFNLPKENNSILKNKFLHNRESYAIAVNKIINHIDFKKCHFIKI